MIISEKPIFISNTEFKIRIDGVVKDPIGNPLQRRCYLYDAGRSKVASAMSDPTGKVVFTVKHMTPNNLWTVRGCGFAHECDDVSPQIRGVLVEG